MPLLPSSLPPSITIRPQDQSRAALLHARFWALDATRLMHEAAEVDEGPQRREVEAMMEGVRAELLGLARAAEMERAA